MKVPAITKWLLPVLMLVAVQALAVGEAEYAAYNQFCRENFGAELEPLTYTAHGNTLTFIASGDWVHQSENSAAIGFETSLPASSFVEYGETTAYGSSTQQQERPFYIHLHHVTGLQTNRIYHYRIVAVDERGNRIESADRIIQTVALPGAVHIPGDLSGPPYNLSSNGTTYVLTQDITANRRAFTFDGTNITLDLNGHTVIYDNGAPALSGVSWDNYIYSDVSTFGVIGMYGVSGHILNGSIVQGQTNSTGDLSIGFNPIYLGANSDNVVEVAGLAVEYAGNSVGGIASRGGANDIHHNIVMDKGTGIDNRHQGIKAFDCKENSEVVVHHNLVKRARHQGIVMAAGAYSNEVYIDSWATNSYGIKPRQNTTIEDNRIFGTGYHTVAIGWNAEADNDWLTVRNNFIHMQGAAPTNRSDEYGAHSSVNGIRLTQYASAWISYDNFLYEGNVIVVKGKDGCMTMRGVQFFSDPLVSNLQFRDNIIKTERMDDETGIAPCVVGHGNSARAGTWLPVIYEDNTFITNSVHVRFGDDYASGGNHQFRHCTFEKFGTRADYETIVIGYWDYHSYGNQFIDSELVGGASLDTPSFEGTPGGIRDYAIGHSLYVDARNGEGAPIVSTPIAVVDQTGQTYAGQTDDQGVARLELVERVYAADQGQAVPDRVDHADHEVRLMGYFPVTVDANYFAISHNVDDPVTMIFTSDGSVVGPGIPSMRDVVEVGGN